jgi:Ca2+-transporting ATPase
MSLTSKEVVERQSLYGKNEIVSLKTESYFSYLIHILIDPMGSMLLILGFLYLFLGKTSDSIVLFISFIPVTAVDVILELKAKNALNALKNTLKPITKVIRNNEIVEISIIDIVPGDTIVFEEGQCLPADGKIIECSELKINEAALTGESNPVEKSSRLYFFAGTTILQGRGTGIVEQIGTQTKFGKIAKLMDEASTDSGPLKKKLNTIIKQIFIIAIFIAISLFTITFLKNHNLIQSLIESLTFAMAAIPEEFPLVFTLYLSMGAYRLSKFGVLVKSLPSVETLGSVNVICTDKTGTLTEGKFQLELIESTDTSISEELLWQMALMSCEEKVTDSMEKAIYAFEEKPISDLENWNLKWDFPFINAGKYMSHVWENNFSKDQFIAMKGSVEGIIEHCLLDFESKDEILKRADFWSSKGKRLLGLAYRTGDFTGERNNDEMNLKFIGLLIFSDPIRKSAKNAIKMCQNSGIIIKMLTGDHPLTAHAIADELELIHSHEYLFTGDQLSKMNQKDRSQAYLQGAIFSRVIPEQKYEMVLALKQSGFIVAMTGDGINDAPALKAADIGISMGENATDVARSSAQMILLKNDFNGIIEAIFEGRKIFSNLKRSFSYLISFHIPIIFFAAVGPISGPGNLLLPIHIVLLKLVVHPVSAFSFENLPAVPTNNKSLMSFKIFFESLLSGILLSIGCFLLYRHVLIREDIVLARSVAISLIFFGNIFLVLVESWPKITIRFLSTALLLILFLFIILNIKFMAKNFYITEISLTYMMQAFFVALICLLPSFILKIILPLLKSKSHQPVVQV